MMSRSCFLHAELQGLDADRCCKNLTLTSLRQNVRCRKTSTHKPEAVSDMLQGFDLKSKAISDPCALVQLVVKFTITQQSGMPLGRR